MTRTIYVCIKQVPDTAEIRIDPLRHTLIRTGVESIINPYDLHALEAAVSLKESWGAKVTAICMGPAQAEKSLREALARGADHAVLLSDRAFSGADTWCTSLTLAHGIRKLGIPNLIICGKQAIDGDTAQVGPELAELLSIPQLLFTQSIDAIDSRSISITHLTDIGTEKIATNLPALISVVKSINIPRLPSLHDWIYAQRQTIEKFDMHSLKILQNSIGLKGSPTRVKKIEGKVYNKKTVWLSQNSAKAAKEIL
ncbi:MAG: electron transfer flavoprotein subunit beta/FixA family protein, partial [Candidatus Brocadiales bacterium]|nr:electron transfer flavoprotein subunit beta/FixA family protein [Candidatus Brocadiales bacterium]